MCEQIHSNAGGDAPQVVRQAVIHRDLQPPGTPGVVRRDAGVRIGEIRGLHWLPVQVDLRRVRLQLPQGQQEGAG